MHHTKDKGDNAVRKWIKFGKQYELKDSER